MKPKPTVCVTCVYLLHSFTSDNYLTTCQVRGETSNGLTNYCLCCQVLGGRKRHRGLKKQLKTPATETKKPQRVRGEEDEREEQRWVTAYRERKQRVKKQSDKEAERDGRSIEYKNEGTEEA